MKKRVCGILIVALMVFVNVENVYSKETYYNPETGITSFCPTPTNGTPAGTKEKESASLVQMFKDFIGYTASKEQIEQISNPVVREIGKQAFIDPVEQLEDYSRRIYEEGDWAGVGGEIATDAIADELGVDGVWEFFKKIGSYFENLQQNGIQRPQWFADADDSIRNASGKIANPSSTQAEKAAYGWTPSTTQSAKNSKEESSMTPIPIGMNSDENKTNSTAQSGKNSSEKTSSTIQSGTKEKTNSDGEYESIIDVLRGIGDYNVLGRKMRDWTSQDLVSFCEKNGKIESDYRGSIIFSM